MLKRLLDVIASTLAIVILAPLMVVLAVAIRLASPGPSLFRQERVGRSGQPFTMLKFRTMQHGNDDSEHRQYMEQHVQGTSEVRENSEGESVFLLEDDRVFALGKMLRRSSLDELPNLFNVFTGSMSLVGPRPPIPYEVEHYSDTAMRRLEVKPGMTGLAQIAGRGGLTFEDTMALDLTYIDSRSMSQDIRIILRTIPAVLRRRGV